MHDSLLHILIRGNIWYILIGGKHQDTFDSLFSKGNTWITHITVRNLTEQEMKDTVEEYLHD